MTRKRTTKKMQPLNVDYKEVVKDEKANLELKSNIDSLRLSFKELSLFEYIVLPFLYLESATKLLFNELKERKVFDKLLNK
tara:strand:- start:149 stop:391 length:243 start_codon:yes stop_codon:yes gene_type:complete